MDIPNALAMPLGGLVIPSALAGRMGEALVDSLDVDDSDKMFKTGATEGEIDDHFGWNQKERKKTSRLHYHGRNERQQRAKVTMMI